MGCGASSKYESSPSQLSDSDAEDESDEDDDHDSTYGLPKKPRQEGRWLWEDSPDVWQAFERTLNERLLDALQLGETEILLTLPNGDTYEVCMKTNVMKHLETRAQMRIRFKAARSSSKDADTPQEGPGPGPRSPPKEKPTYYGGEWQWQAGPGSWKRFNHEIQTILQIAKKYKKYKVVFGLKGTIYEVNFEDLVQKNLSSGYQRRIRWHPAKQFQWELRPTVWVDYEEEENDTLVIALAEGVKKVRYQTRGSEYEVNFQEMIQENISTNSARSRRVRLKGSADHDKGATNNDAGYFAEKPEPSPTPAWPPKPSPGVSPRGDGPDRGRPEPSRPPFASFFAGRKGAEAADAARKAADEGPREKRWGLGGRAVPKAGVPAPPRAAAVPKAGAVPKAAARAPKAPKAQKMPGKSSWKPPPRAEKRPEPDPGPRPGPDPSPRPGPGGRAGARPSGKPDAKPSGGPSPTDLKLPRGVNLPDSAKGKKAATEMFSEFQELKSQPISNRKKAYRTACLKWHPDKNPDDEETATEMFQFLQDLKDWLLDD